MYERPRRRLGFLTVLLLVLSALVLGQLIHIQVLSHAELSELGELRRTRRIDLPPGRGRVWDQNGHLLVGNLVYYDISAEPALIRKPGDVANALAPLLDMDTDELSRTLSSDISWVPLKSAVPQEVRDRIVQEKLAHVVVEPVWRRTYPERALVAHVLGFVNAENRGYYGVEGYFDAELRGHAGSRVYQQDGWSQVIPLELAAEIPSQPGVDLVLTLDRTIQALVEAELMRALQETGAKKGTIIVMDPRSGAILALAAAPAYDPNRYWAVTDARLFANPVISGQYEPGSVFKVLTVAAALESGLVSPDTVFYDEGYVEVGGQLIRNATGKVYGPVTLTEVLVYSLNVEVAKISTMLGPERFYPGIRAFGIGRRTGVDLEGEIIGELRVPGDWQWHESDLATNAFGQGLAVTPLQMITAVAAIANDGLLMQPHVVAEKVGADGSVVRAQPASTGRAVSSETAHLVVEMMTQTVEHGIKRAQVPGYRIAGKTGTAQIPTPFGYDEEKTIASFVGFAPVDDPQVIVLVRLDEPTSSEWGSQTAAPAFARLAERLFVLLKIPPDDVRAVTAHSR